MGCCRDAYGYPLTTSQAAAEAYTDGVRDLLRLRAGAAARIATSVTLDPTFALGHATLALLAHEMCVQADIPARLADARLHAGRATERERSHVHAVERHLQGDHGPLLSHLASYPRDAVLLSVAMPTIAFAGVTDLPEQAWSIVETAAPAYGDDPWINGLMAFVRQEQRRFDEAMESVLPLALGGAERRARRPRPGARALRDRRPRRGAGLDGRLGARRRRAHRQPHPLLLARGAARALARRHRCRPAPVRRPGSSPAMPWAAARWSTPARCSSAGRSRRAAPTYRRWPRWSPSPAAPCWRIPRRPSSGCMPLSRCWRWRTPPDWRSLARWCARHGGATHREVVAPPRRCARPAVRRPVERGRRPAGRAVAAGVAARRLRRPARDRRGGADRRPAPRRPVRRGTTPPRRAPGPPPRRAGRGLARRGSGRDDLVALSLHRDLGQRRRRRTALDVAGRRGVRRAVVRTQDLAAVHGRHEPGPGACRRP
ncbi:hypothetical protein [Nocardioides convexus]|uniref:hypothetical protein n=1 Tax=Nocardioides convexus TaxID=2712224 RepID=UPI002418898E|nr:hypothetical protein [Nocardioides convexus]